MSGAMTALVVLDETCAAAVEDARAALESEIPAEAVGNHMTVVAEADLVVTHMFEANQPGYAGWQWAVTVTRIPESDHVTVSELALLPGPGAILAPAWIPWSDRVESGDLGPRDRLPVAPDDPRLAPGFTGADDDSEQLHPATWQLGLGRARVLSMLGRSEAAERWRRGTGGPRNEMTRLAPDQCSTCGFLVPLGGALGQECGVCANSSAPFDGTVVTMDHGCGAHSEAPPIPPVEAVAEMVTDDDDIEIAGVAPASAPTDTGTDPSATARTSSPEDCPAP